MDPRYIAVNYNTILHPAQQTRRYNFGQTSNSRKTPIPRPNGRAMDVSCKLFGEKWPRDIGSALLSPVIYVVVISFMVILSVLIGFLWYVTKILQLWNKKKECFIRIVHMVHFMSFVLMWLCIADFTDALQDNITVECAYAGAQVCAWACSWYILRENNKDLNPLIKS